jgi:outer membrane protein
MRNMLWTLGAAVLISLLFAGPAMAQSGKIVYVDSYRIRTEYKEFLEAQDQFDKELDDWQKEGMEMQDEVDSLKKDLSDKALLLSEDARAKKQEQIDMKEAALQKYMVDVFGQGGRAEQRNKELTKPLLDKITAVLEKIAQEKNYDYVFDAVNGNIAYAKKSLDITDQVLEELQKLQ